MIKSTGDLFALLKLGLSGNFTGGIITGPLAFSFVFLVISAHLYLTTCIIKCFRATLFIIHIYTTVVNDTTAIVPGKFSLPDMERIVGIFTFHLGLSQQEIIGYLPTNGRPRFDPEVRSLIGSGLLPNFVVINSILSQGRYFTGAAS